jgi:hypothetical protein
MDIHDLTANQFNRAAAIKEQLASLNQQLRNILGEPTNSGPVPKTNRTMSASAKRKIAAGQRARWAKLRRAKAERRSSNSAAKRAMSAEARAKLSAKLKRYWAARKAGKKN